MEDPDAVGQAGAPGQGPYMKMYLQICGGVIQRASFETYSCPVAIACGSWVMRWLSGRTIDQALALGPGELQTVLGGLPLGKEHCASLAVNALRSALANAEQEQ